MSLNRRAFLSGMGGIAAIGLDASAASAQGRPLNEAILRGSLQAQDAGLLTNSLDNQSLAFQRMLDAASDSDETIFLPAGIYVVGGIRLPQRTRLVGVAGATQLVFNSDGFMLVAQNVERVLLDGITLDGANRRLGEGMESLLDVRNCANVTIRDCIISGSGKHGIYLENCAGRIESTTFSGAMEAALYSVNNAGMLITGNVVKDCSNGGIWVHRWQTGDDKTQIISNRVERIGSTNGGTGQWGNGINVFRADNVMVANNTIEDCAFSAIRANSASNIQIAGNHCRRSGETAIYAEFAFEGAAISGNVVDGATMGISIANFNEGGRLAVCTGNLIRNMKTVGPYAPDDPGFGMGISIEADTSCTGNVIEGAPLFGIKIGWGPFMRNIVAAGNVIRDSGTGIYVTAVEGKGRATITDNMIEASTNAAIAGFRWNDQVTGELAGKDSDDDGMLIARNTIG